MRLAQLKSFALSFPETTFVKQWGESLVFKVVGKVFFLISLDGETVEGCVLKCEPVEFDELSAFDGVTQAPYFAKRMWVRISDLTVFSEKELKKRISQSFDLVVSKLPKKTQAALAKSDHHHRT